MVEKRRYLRTEFNGRVRVTHPQFGSVEANMRDISNGGVFLFTGDQIDLPLGAELSIQALDIEDAPVLSAQIVRSEPEGIALMFKED